MKAFLMYRDRDLNLDQQLRWNEQVLTRDLELDTLFRAMALGDSFLYDVAKSAILSNQDSDLDPIRYRQAILKDCLNNPSVVRDIYHLPIQSIENKRKNWMGIFSTSPGGILSGAITMLEMFVGLLEKLRAIADEHAGSFESEGFTAFFDMINEELDDAYFASIGRHLEELQFRRGILLSMELGRGNEGANYALRKPNEENRGLVQQILGPRQPVYTIRIHPREEHGGRALEEIKLRGLNLVSDAVAQSADHIDSFFELLRAELAFYIGCINLAEQLAQIEEPLSFPLPVESDNRQHSFQGLYDVCLALTMKQKVVGNDINADQNDLVIITGANQGGKSTFLRSIGLAQLMMQCGMFVPAESFCANLSEGVCTHFRREEDTTMESGKLDEELSRMSAIADHVTPDSLVLFNESFSATNDREGSEIARQIVYALLQKKIKVVFVTHLYEFARGFYDRGLVSALFLRAEREADGTRTFKLVEGIPLKTSFGEDLYRRLFEKKVTLS